MFSLIKQLVLFTAILLVTPLIAAPVSEARSPSVIFRRVDPKPVVCGPRSNQKKYTKDEVESAYNELVRLMNEPKENKPHQTPTKVFPKEFHVSYGSMRSVQVTRKLETIEDGQPSQPKTKYLEFPLMHKKYTGGDPGPDRVLAIVYGKKEPNFELTLYCFSMTHRGMNDKEHQPADTDDEEGDLCK